VPKVAAREMVIAQDAPGFISKICSSRLYVLTGMRLGEVLALRDRSVDLDKKVIQVREAVEETKAHGVRIKSPKTKAGQRDLTLPEIAVEALSEYRRRLLETRMKLGIGKLPSDALLFSMLDGGPLRSGKVSSDWRDCRKYWYARDHLSRPAQCSRQSAHRARRRYCRHLQTARAR
jgi:integrase